MFLFGLDLANFQLFGHRAGFAWSRPRPGFSRRKPMGNLSRCRSRPLDAPVISFTSAKRTHWNSLREVPRSSLVFPRPAKAGGRTNRGVSGSGQARALESATQPCALALSLWSGLRTRFLIFEASRSALHPVADKVGPNELDDSSVVVTISKVVVQSGKAVLLARLLHR